MAKYAFFCIPAHGHLMPTLPLVTELVSRGEQVTYYTTGEHKESVEAAGADWRDFPSCITVMPDEEGERALGDLVESLRAERIEYIVYDFFFIWGGLLARALHIPAINVRSTYANNEYFSERTIHQHRSRIWPARENTYSTAHASIHALAQFVQVGEILKVPVPEFEDSLDVYSASEALNIYMIPRVFQPYAETFDERHIFVGSSILSRPGNGDFPFEALDGRPLLYIALGTLFNNRADIFKACIKAFGQTDWQVVLSRGRQST